MFVKYFFNVPELRYKKKEKFNFFQKNSMFASFHVITTFAPDRVSCGIIWTWLHEYKHTYGGDMPGNKNVSNAI